MPSTTKKYTNSEISEYLQNIATAYEIKNKSKFRITAYQNAADTTGSYPESIFNLWQKDPKLLDSVPNIGPSILNKIDYLLRHHRPYPSLKKIYQSIHPAVFTFTKINGLGPLNAHKITQQLHFSSNPTKALDQLVVYAQIGKIRTLPTFGEKSEKQILNNTLAFLERKTRLSLASAQKLAKKTIRYLQLKFPTIQFVPLGSLRRLNPTIGDIDIAAASSTPKPILDHFINYSQAIQIISRGSHKASIRLLHDVHIDLMVKPPSRFGSLLQHFTGSRQHNILLRKHALKLGFSLSEYGIKDLKSGVVHRFDTEAKFYQFLGLHFIPPRLRVGEDELEIYKMI